MNKRGQAALEFLMTYGWAIFVMLGALAALAYFGVFDTDQFLVEKCSFSSGIICVDFVIVQDGVSIVIQNAMSTDIENVSLTVQECSGNPINISLLDSGSQSTFVDACTLQVTDPFRSTLTFNYTNPVSGLEHTKRGEVAGRVE